MVLKFFETLDSVAAYLEKQENESGIRYIRRNVQKAFGSESKLACIFYCRSGPLKHDGTEFAGPTMPGRTPGR